jgi:hypothetical protein
MSILIDRRDRAITQSASIIGFETPRGPGWPVWNRYLTVHGKRAYDLGLICGTCGYLFERMEGANDTIDVGTLTDRLSKGIGMLDDGLVDTLALLMPTASYRVVLLQLRPRLVQLGSTDDYFAAEQIANQGGVDPFWGLPHHPRVPYYRAGQRDIVFDRGRTNGAAGHFFEFVVPMYPEQWLAAERTADYAAALSEGALPTAVAISVLDVKGPATRGIDHWCLGHYLLDGHHKVAAAARLGLPLTIISFLAEDQCVVAEGDIEAALDALDRI